MKIKQYLTMGLLACMALVVSVSSCSEDGTDPNNLLPYMSAYYPESLTSTSALLMGNMESNGSKIQEYGFLLSTTESELLQSLDKLGDNIKHKVGEGHPTGDFSLEVFGLTHSTTYHYCVYAIAGRTIARSDIYEFTTNAIGLPGLDIYDTSLTESTIQLTCSFYDGGANLSSYGFEYYQGGEDSTPTTTTRLSSSVCKINYKEEQREGNFSATIKDLEANTKYMVRAYASNGVTGEAVSPWMVYTTAEKITPSIEISRVEYWGNNIGSTWINLSAKITDKRGQTVTEKGFVYSSINTRPEMGNFEGIFQVKVESADDNLATTISNLTPATNYYIRAYAAIVVDGKTYYGYSEVLNVMTSEFYAPTFNYLSFQQDDETLSLSTEINTNGVEIKEKGFCWSTKGEPVGLGGADVQSAVSTVAGNKIELSIQVEEETTYYVMAYAKYDSPTGEEVAYSESYERTTSRFSRPRIEYPQSSQDNAVFTFKAKVNNEMNAIITGQGFCWSETNNEPTVESTVVEGTLNANTIQSTMEFEENKNYYVRAYLKFKLKEGKSEEIVYSSTVNYWTNYFSRPSLSDVSYDNVTKTSVRLYAQVNANGVEIKERGFLWGTNSAQLDHKQAVDGADFVLNISDLNAGTQYYYNAYIIYNIGSKEETSYYYNSDTYWNYFNTTDITGATLSEPEYTQMEDFKSIQVTSSVTNLGDGELVKKGFVWSNSDSYPTLDDCLGKVELGVDDNFEATISDLEQNANYYVRAYATTQAYGQTLTAYSSYRYFEPLRMELPSLGYNIECTAVTDNSFTVKGYLEYAGKPGDQTKVGFCWSTEDVSGDQMTNRAEATLGSDNYFTLTVDQLDAKKTYYVYAYATNPAGTNYNYYRLTVTLKTTPGKDDQDNPSKD